MTKRSLSVLDFSTGIRGSLINANFNLIKQWIDAERLRTGGWGIVNGFELTKDLPNFCINIGSGVIINEDGEEIIVDAHTEIVGPPTVDHALEEECVVSSEGKIETKFPIYSNTLKHILFYDKGDNNSDITQSGLGDLFAKNEFTILVSDTAQKLTEVDIMSISDNVIYVSGAKFGGKTVEVTYDHADDRIDAIMLKKDGSEYKYVRELISTSPSQAVVSDYLTNGYYLIGMAYWHVGHVVDVEFITIDRTYRNIYVNEKGVLFINGKQYMDQKFIYFVKPDTPEEDDLWYNVEEDVLYIYRPDKNGKLEWRVVNDLSRSITDVYTFTEANNPEDLQTFIFDVDPKLRFIPKQHQLTIIIDQVVLMEDQYDELYKQDGEDAASGYGFKLKYPLERASIVEIRINHNVIVNSALKDLFQHISTFNDQGSFTLTAPAETGHIFDTNGEFELGNGQLEVFLNGIRLLIDKEFIETPSRANNISHEVSNGFVLKVNTKANDVISYKITRHMWCYDNLSVITDALEDKVETYHAEVKDMKTVIDNLANNATSISNNYDSFVTETNKKIADLETNKISHNDVIAKDHIDTSITSNTINSKISLVKQIGSPSVYLEGIGTKDYILVYYVKNDAENAVPLLEGHDYTVSTVANGIDIDLLSKWTGVDGAKLYIKGFKIGL